MMPTQPIEEAREPRRIESKDELLLERVDTDIKFFTHNPPGVTPAFREVIVRSGDEFLVTGIPGSVCQDLGLDPFVRLRIIDEEYVKFIFDETRRKVSLRKFCHPEIRFFPESIAK